MGDPQHAYPVIHVTGTNGKGSTAQMVTRLLMAQGLTRRHVHQPPPRADQRALRPQRRADQRRRLRRADRRRRRPRRADRRPADLLRGRAPRRRSAGSPTSPSTSPSSRSGCSAAGTPRTWSTPRSRSITNIGMDHNEFAGPTLADIAREKAGIIKPGSAVVIGETDPDLVAVLAAEPAATRLLRGIDFETAGNQLALGGRLVDLRTPTTIYPEVFVPLHGAHQGDNAVDRAHRRRGVLRRAAGAGRRRGGVRRRRRCPGGSRCSATSRSSSSTVPTTRRAPTRAPRCSSTTSTPRAGGSSSSARSASRRRCSRRCAPTSSTSSSPARPRRPAACPAGRSPRRRWGRLRRGPLLRHRAEACAQAMRCGRRRRRSRRRVALRRRRGAAGAHGAAPVAGGGPAAGGASRRPRTANRSAR